MYEQLRQASGEADPEEMEDDEREELEPEELEEDREDESEELEEEDEEPHGQWSQLITRPYRSIRIAPPRVQKTAIKTKLIRVSEVTIDATLFGESWFLLRMNFEPSQKKRPGTLPDIPGRIEFRPMRERRNCDLKKMPLRIIRLPVGAPSYPSIKGLHLV